MPKAKILGKLKGIIASAKEPSRNGRIYTESFWDAKFNSDLFIEGLENKMLFGWLYHPPTQEEYEQIEIDDDKSAVVLVDVKKKGLEYEGTFDILPTKAGQCLRNLLDIGCCFGVSSRGLANQDYDVYDEHVAEDYDLITWDIVALPGVKSCRLHEVTNVSENFKNKKSKQQIMESLNKIAKEDEALSLYINDALKAKEDFNTEAQIEELNFNDLNLIQVDYKGIPYYDDGIHGKHKVLTQGRMSNYTFKPGERFLPDDIQYVKSRDMYTAIGDWEMIP